MKPMRKLTKCNQQGEERRTVWIDLDKVLMLEFIPGTKVATGIINLNAEVQRTHIYFEQGQTCAVLETPDEIMEPWKTEFEAQPV